MAAGSQKIGRLIEAIVRVSILRPWVTVVVAIAVTAGGLFYAAANLGINTDTADMISPDLDWRQDFISYRDSFPARDRNIVAVIDGSRGERSEAYARDLAVALRSEPDLFPSVFFPAAEEFFERNGLLYLGIDELEALAERLISAQPLLGRLSDDVSGAGVLGVLSEAVESESNPSLQGAADLDRILAEIARTLAASRQDERRPIAWGELIGIGADISARQLVLIRPDLDFSRIRPARQAMERLREIGDQLTAQYAGDVTLRLTGTLAMEHEELTSITQSATAAGLAALAMVVIVLLWALRSLALLVVAIVVLLAGLSLTAAFAAMTVGSLNLLSVAFAVLYVGLGVDFILHMTLRTQELRANGAELSGALLRTAGGVGSSLLICAVTTAAGFFAFIPTEFDGVSELGLISGGGMIISFFVSLTLLPALTVILWRGRGRQSIGTDRLLGRMKAAPPALIIGGFSVVAALAALQFGDLEFDGNPIHLRDPDAESVRTLEDLAADSEAPLFNLAVVVPDAAAAGAVAESLRALPTVERVQTSESLIPANQEDKLFVIEDLKLVLGPTLGRFDRGVPRPDALVAGLEELLIRLDDSVVSTDGERAFTDEAAAWLSSWQELDDDEALDRATALDTDILGNLVVQIQRLERGLEAQMFSRDDLPAELVDRWVSDSGEEVVEIIPRDDLNDNIASERFVREVRSVAANATGLPVVYEEAAATVIRAFRFALGYALVIVGLLLVLFLRSLRDTLTVLVPIVFAAVLTAGLSALFGLPLNFANIIALPLLVGVGVDSGIHMVHRMRTEPPDSGDPLGTSTSRAVFMSALTTIASFGNLAFSTHAGMASMGQLLTLGMVMSLIAILLLLPALMRLGRPA